MRFSRQNHNTRADERSQAALTARYTPKDRADATIEGVCIHHHLLESGWGFATVLTDEKIQVSITGMLGGELYDGARVTVHGFWAHHDRYGWQVKLRALEVMLATSLDGVQAWFQDRFPEVGPIRARSLLATFGTAIWDIIENDHARLAEAPQVGDKLAEQIHHTYINYKHERDAYVYLAKVGLGPDAIRKAFNLWGRNTQKTIEGNPYDLTRLPGVGFKQADRVARAAGVKAVDPRRILAGYVYAMKVLEQEGSTCASAQKIIATCASQEVLGINITTVKPYFDEAVKSGGLVGEFGAYFRGVMADAEHLIATQVAELVKQGEAHELG